MVVAEDEVKALYGMGYLHGRYRPLQTILITNAGCGRLAEQLAPKSELVHLDALAHRLELFRLAEAEVKKLSPWAKHRLQAYLRGIHFAIEKHGWPFELRMLLSRLPLPELPHLIAGFMLSSYLGLAEGQERMERALIDAVRAGASPGLIQRMFEPHLDDTHLERFHRHQDAPGLGFATHGFRAVGGSNTWAVTGAKSASGNALLAGDPHLQINQMPALFFETAIRVGRDNYWMGATIPGLPGIAVGRNRWVAWSGTFSVPDNVDFFEEERKGMAVVREEGQQTISQRRVQIKRRFRSTINFDFYSTNNGVFEQLPEDGKFGLTVGWAGEEGAAEALTSYLKLLSSKNSDQAVEVLEKAHTMSLHFVVADTEGQVRYRQQGRIPRRSEDWSGLAPARAGQGWTGFYTPDQMPKGRAEEGFEASANEARLAPDGGLLSTLAQPAYRLTRIRHHLKDKHQHSLEDFARIQQDTYSLQVDALLHPLAVTVPDSYLKSLLAGWDACYHPQSVGATAFEVLRKAALRALAPELGGDWFLEMLSRSELPVWWCHGLDRLLADDFIWQSPDRWRRLQHELTPLLNQQLPTWGEAQQLDMKHLFLGGLPQSISLDRGPYPLRGGLATPCQGNIVRLPHAEVAVGPAYRFLTDLGTDEAKTAIPGGISGSAFDDTYDCFLQEYLDGEYHILRPPEYDLPL